MAGNTKVPDKKTLVAIIIIAVLVIAAIVGTVAFLRNRGTTEATDLSSYNEQSTGTTQEEQETTDTQEQTGEPATQNAEEQATEGTEPAATEPTGTADTTTAGGNQGTAGIGTTGGATGTTTTTTGGTGTTTTTDNIQETTISREEITNIPERLVEDNEYRTWNPTELDAPVTSVYTDIINNVETPDITVTKTAITQSGSTLVQAGETITYAITVQNNTDEKIERIYVTDAIPEGTTYVSSMGDVETFADTEGNVTSLRWLVDVDANATTTVEFTVEVNKEATGIISNVAMANGEESNEGNPIEHSVITVVKANTLESETVKPGDTFDYTITVTNTGDIAGTVKVTDEVPGQLEIIETDPEATVDGNNVDFGEVTVPEKGTVTLTISVKVKTDATGTITNTAIVNGEEVKDPEDINTVNIEGVKANTLEGDTVKPGDEFAYTITLTNSGNTTGTVPVTDEVPGQLEITGTNPKATVTGNKVDFGNVTVTPETPVTLTINVKVKADATGTITNTAKVDGEDTPDEEVTIENVPKITGVKTNEDSDKVVKPGEEVTYKIKLSNNGNAEGTTTITDKLPDGVIYKDSSDNGTYNSNTKTVIWNDVKVPVGTDSKVLTVTVTIDKSATGKIQNTAYIENEEKHDEGLDLVKITAEKVSDVTTIATVGQEVTYTIKAVNNGTIKGDAVITDQIPAELEYKNATLTNVDGDTISVKDGIVTWNVKDLEPGEDNARTLTITATVKDFEGKSETITNEVKVDGEKTSETTIEAGKPVITSTKTSEIISCERNELDGTTVHEGDKIKYTITVKNDGTVEKQINITDPIKEGLSYVDGTLKANFAGTEITSAKVEDGVVKLENYTLTTGGTLTIEFTVQVNTLPEGVSNKVIGKNIAVVDGNNKEDEKGDYEVVKPIITTEKSSSIVSCSKNQTTGTIVHEGDQIQYEIKVTNSGETSGKVTVEDTIKSGLTYVQGTVEATVDGSAVSGIAVNNGKVMLSDYTLEAHKTLIIKFTVQVDSLPEGVYGKTIDANVVTVNGETTTDTTGEYDVVKPHITASKSSAIVECSLGQTTERKAHEGDTIRYTITVENNGTESDIINVTDKIPDDVTYVDNSLVATLNDGTPVEDVTINNRVVSLTAYELVAGKTLTITFDVTVDPLEEGTYSNQIANNIAIVNGANTPDDGGYEVEKPQTKATKSVDKVEAEFGEELTYTITVKNLTNVTTPVNISDRIPTGTEYVPNSITVNGKSVSDRDHYVVDGDEKKVIYTGELTKQDEELRLVFKVKITEQTCGKDIINTANVNGDTPTATTKVIKKVYSIAKQEKPIDLILVLDVSGSMNNYSRLSNMKTAANNMIDKLFPDEKRTDSTVSLITFSSKANTKFIAKGYDDKSDVKSTITWLGADGGTNINEALKEVNSLITKNSEKLKNGTPVVVFLGDGAPTQPYYIYNGNKDDWGTKYGDYSQNTEDNIISQAEALRQKATVYSIGLGIDKLYTVRDNEESQKAALYTLCPNMSTANITATKSYTINGEETTENKASSGDEVKYTITLTNNSDKNGTVTVNDYAGSTDDVRISNISNRGYDRWGTVTWENVTVPANGSLTLTYTITVKERRWGDREITLSKEVTEIENSKTGCGADNCIRANDGNYYHWESEQSYARRILKNNIASSTDKYKEAKDGTAESLQSIFDQIFNETQRETTTHYIKEELPATVKISETRKLDGNTVQVKIGETTKTYIISDLKNGVDGIRYIENVGFEWTVTEELATSELSLEYKVTE